MTKTTRMNRRSFLTGVGAAALIGPELANVGVDLASGPDVTAVTAYTEVPPIFEENPAKVMKWILEVKFEDDDQFEWRQMDGLVRFCEEPVPVEVEGGVFHG